MKLLDRIKTIFQKKQKSVQIATIENAISLPSRKELQKDKAKIKLLDEYKAEYLQALLQKKTVVTPDLQIDELRERMNMYITLLGNALNSNDEYVDSFSKVLLYNDGTKRCEHLIKMAKLKAYFYDVTRLEMETKLHLVALKEILTEKPYLSPNKKRSLRQEIANLSTTILIFQNQKTAISLEISRYLNEYAKLGNEEFIDPKLKSELLNQKKEELLEIMHLLMPKVKWKNERVSEVEIALYEKMIEQYFYRHPEVAENLEERIATLEKYLQENGGLHKISEEDKKEIKRKKSMVDSSMDYLQYLERRIKVNDISQNEYLTQKKSTEDDILFYKSVIQKFEERENAFKEVQELGIIVRAVGLYHSEAISKETIDRFYRIKFEEIKDQLLINQEKTLNELNHFEMECYQNMIAQRISDILMGVYAPLNRILEMYENAEDRIEAIKQIGMILKGRSQVFSYWEILNDPARLGLLLAIEDPDKFPIYFENTIVSKQSYPNVDFQKEILTLEENIPLATVYEIMYYNNDSSKDFLYRIYLSYKEKRNGKTDTIKLPEGITHVDFGQKTFETEKQKQFKNRIRNNMSEKDVEMPSTLISIEGGLFRNVSCRSITLNHGLCKMAGKVFEHSHIQYIVSFPSTLVDTSDLTFEDFRTSSIAFDNFLDNPDLLEKTTKYSLPYQLIQALYTADCRKVTRLSHDIRPRESINSYFDRGLIRNDRAISPFQHQDTFEQTVRLSPKIHRIYFRAHNLEICIQPSDVYDIKRIVTLRPMLKHHDPSHTDETLRINECSIVWDHIVDLVEEKLKEEKKLKK